MQQIENQWITLPDGRRLAARIWLPKGDNPTPAILEYLPYRKRDGTAARDETTHTVFCAAGYACIRVDIAGTGDSEGQFDDEYSEKELRDGEAVIEWIAAQPWCDGTLGMIGISWGGFNGLQLAFRRPAALKAVVSVASTADRYADDIHFMGGCLLSDNANWGSQMFAYLTRPADPELRNDWRDDWLQRMKTVPAMSADWLRHPNRDDFWKHGSVCEDWSRIKTPVLAITGWADAYLNTPANLVENLQCPAKALVGPWEHRYAHISKLGAADFHSEVINWFDHWLKGADNGAQNLPDYRVFMQEHYGPKMHLCPRKGRWIAEKDWPSENVKPQTLYLTNNGLAGKAAIDTTTLNTPLSVGQASGFFCAGMRIDNEFPGDQAEDDAQSLCFDTTPRDTPFELLGRAELQLAFSVDQPCAQIMARLCDVAPDGVSQRISYRPLNLTHFASHEAPEQLVPGQVYHAKIRLNQCAHLLRPGHKLRLALSNSYWPIIWPSPVKTKITLDLKDCALTLPVRQVAVEILPANPGPPQEFPTLQDHELRPQAFATDYHQRPDGTLIQKSFDDYGKSANPDHGLITGSHVHMNYRIHPDDPTSAEFETSWNFTFERGDWQVEIDTECKMTCDRENFYLHQKLRATEGAEKSEILTKEWSQTVPRGLH